MTMNKHAKSSTIRIIAGSWRGRRLPVLDSDGLRPTTDRVRETLFNWLMHDIAGANCLDLFAGSGVLGIECLSRGAKFVHFVEQNRQVAKALDDNLNVLLNDRSQVKLTIGSALDVLNANRVNQYDVVFLDPPFQSELLAKAIILLQESGCLNEGALIYIEQDSKQSSVVVPETWSLHREGKAGQSRYCLYIT